MLHHTDAKTTYRLWDTWCPSVATCLNGAIKHWLRIFVLVFPINQWSLDKVSLWQDSTWSKPEQEGTPQLAWESHSVQRRAQNQQLLSLQRPNSVEPAPSSETSKTFHNSSWSYARAGATAANPQCCAPQWLASAPGARELPTPLYTIWLAGRNHRTPAKERQTPPETLETSCQGPASKTAPSGEG